MTPPPFSRRVALVLGARVLPDGRPSQPVQRRAAHAAGLWHAGAVDHILCCGGGTPSEASVLRTLCIDTGVPHHAMHLETRSTTTEENLRFAAPLLQQIGADQVVLVTDPWHAPRARLVARRMGICMTSNAAPWPPQMRSATVLMLLREGAALLWYTVSGKGKR